jgi:actin-like ATPase involved in cell morphogenesis
MGRIAIDFGTGNTLLARLNENTGQTETVEIPGITTEVRYRLRGDEPERAVRVIPSLIHYSETETLIGDQVLSRGLAEHPDTFRWMKRKIAQRVTRRKKTAQGHKSPAQAGEDFLRLALNYASEQVAFDSDEFTFTAPTEAFEDFQDWLRRLSESLGIRRLRLLDEPTACVLGYHGAARKDDRFVVVDFGCGTLDVSAVRIDLAAREDRKAVQLGQAGRDLGGLDIDHWLAEDFCRRHQLDDRERHELEAVILRQAETAKIALSDPTQAEAEMQILNQLGRKPRLLATKYSRSCDQCERGRPGDHSTPVASCLGCLLLANDFLKHARETVDRAIENATAKAGLRRADVVKVLVTGGTSLVPCFRRLLTEMFDRRVEYQSPFDAVAQGACGGRVEPILQHDYCIGCYNPGKPEDYRPLFGIGTDYPTPRDAIRKWVGGTVDGQVRCGLVIYEVSRMKRGVFKTNERGEIIQDHDDFDHICLNPENPTFIVADPPINKERDRKRFLCSFWVDGHRRLLVTVLDNLAGKTLLKDHPVVRL